MEPISPRKTASLLLPFPWLPLSPPNALVHLLNYPPSPDSASLSNSSPDGRTRTSPDDGGRGATGFCRAIRLTTTLSNCAAAAATAALLAWRPRPTKPEALVWRRRLVAKLVAFIVWTFVQAESQNPNCGMVSGKFRRLLLNITCKRKYFQ